MLGKSLFLVPLVACMAASAPAAEPKDTIDELTATYARLHGFVAKYTFDDGKKSLKVVMGIDRKSKLTAFEMLKTKDGVTEDLRQWNTLADRYFVTSGEAKRRIDGSRREMDQLIRLASGFGGFSTINEWPPPPITVLLTKESVGMLSGTNAVPGWRSP